MPSLETSSSKEKFALSSSHHLLWLEKRQLIEKQTTRSNISGTPKAKRSARLVDVLRTLTKFLRLLRLDRPLSRHSLQIETLSFELPFPEVPPSFDGYRILHLTDLHFDAIPSIENAILDAAGIQPMDLVVMTGDYIDDTHLDPDIIRTPMERLVRGLEPKDGFLATLGNHDSARMVPVLERMGIHVLINETMAIRRDKEWLLLTGLDDVQYFYTELATRAFQSSPRSAFKIALVHSPEAYQVAADNGYHLYLCGHTHGGQICLPTGRPLITHLDVGNKFAKGMWNHKQMTGYTSRGAGVAILPIRLFCPAEITFFTLRRGHVSG